MNFSDLKLNDRFKINAPGWKRTQAWVVEQVSPEWIGIVDQREIVPHRNITTAHLHISEFEGYAVRGEIEKLPPFEGEDTYLRNGLASANPDRIPDSLINAALSAHQQDVAANIERAEANLNAIPFGEAVPYDLGDLFKTEVIQ